MRVPYSWLKQYVDIDLSPEELGQRMTMAGLELDRVEYPWPNIVTAQITWLEHIKGSDHLSATRVTTGDEEFSVVCGAPNIKLHDKVPLAKVGAKVGEITIQAKKAMGVLSEGMLCSSRELGISDDHSGIYILPPDTPLGIPLGKLLGDAVIELDIKANRGDLFCMLGIAREVAAFTGKPLNAPTIEVKESGKSAKQVMRLKVLDPDLCPRYTARVIRNIKIGPSPDWMQERLTAAGMRPINNVVDITNYVMLELGQPLHAFDYDKVAEHTIIVRRAEMDEELTTLDGVTRHLTSDMLLITDPVGPNVIAGIFGGARVEVDASTKTVLLEAAHFNPVNIRRTAQAVGLRTESSSRFEKDPDIELTTLASDRAAQLLTELAGGVVAPGRVDFYPQPIHQREISFRLGQVKWLTGMDVTTTEAIAALTALGFGVTEQDDKNAAGDDLLLRVIVPTWRNDVQEGADLVEEVARIVGFDRIPSSIPEGPLPAPIADDWFQREDRVRDILVGAGLTEIVSYTLTSRVSLARLLPGRATEEEQVLLAPASVIEGAQAPTPEADMEIAVNRPESERRQIEVMAARLPAIALANSLSSEHEVLRLTLMANLLSAVRENSKHETSGLWFFELGRRYLPTPELASGAGLPQERRTLCIALSGPLTQSNWTDEAPNADFFDIKGVAETLLAGLKVSTYRVTPAQHPTFHPGRCALVEVQPTSYNVTAQGDAALTVPQWLPLGVLGEVHPEVADRFDLTQRAYVMELDLERLFLATPANITHHSVSRYPAAQRDLAILVGIETEAAEVAATIRLAAGDLLRDLRLFDLYTGEGIPAGKKSLAYTLTYQSPERTMTDAEIEAIQTKALAALRERFGAELRG